jgi:hypothetical protein
MAKTKRILVLIADGVPDSTGWSIRSERVQLPSAPVPVSFNYQSFKREGYGYGCGEAALEMVGDRVYATFDFYDIAPELLLNAYPGVGGVVLEDGSIKVQHVGIHYVPNPDHRIENFGQQGMFEIYNKQLRLRHDS